MDYGDLFRQAWDIIWKNKFLILLGVLVVLGSAGGGDAAQNRVNWDVDNQDFQNLPFGFDFNWPFENRDASALAIGGILLLSGLIILLALAFWVLATVARGGLIFGADAINAGGTPSFSEAFSAGWQKVLRLLGIGLIPAIPGFLILLLSAASMLMYTGIRMVDVDRALAGLPNITVVAIASFLVCILGIAAAILSLMRTFANRACMLEDLGVIDSYRRGFAVLGKEIGSVIVLFLLQIVLSLAIGLTFFIPTVVVSLCCLAWPFLLLIEGAFAAFYSTLWTLAWSQWTYETAVELEIAQ